MKRKFRYLIAVIAVVCALSLALAGCTQQTSRYITSITQVGGNIVAYYSDGTSQTIGSAGGEFSLEDVYEAAKTIEGEDYTYEQFLKDYVQVETAVDNSKAINRALASSVKFYTEFRETVPIVENGPPMRKQTGLYMGSGVIYRKDVDYTYMITNYHVVYSKYANRDNANGNFAEKIVCYMYGSEKIINNKTDAVADGEYTTFNYGEYGIECTLVGGSLTNDIAIVRAKTSDMTAINPDFLVAEFADSYHVGQTAIAIGNPEGEGISASQGIVSVADEYISLNIDGTARSYRSMRIDTAIYGGNSGGGLFNTEGKLIGITNAGDGEDQSINFAVPLEIAKGVADNILDAFGDGSGGSVSAQTPTLGVTVTSSNSRYVYDSGLGYGEIVETITVQSVQAGSIAQTLGLQTNDVLTGISVGGVSYALNRNFDISDALLTARVGSEITVTYFRGGQSQTSGSYTMKASDFSAVQ